MRSLVFHHVLPSVLKLKNSKLNRYFLSVTMVFIILIFSQYFYAFFLGETRFLFFYPTMFLISYLFGFGPAVLSIALSTALVWYFLMTPLTSFSFIFHADAMKVIVYVASSFFVSWVTRKGYLSEKALTRNNEILRSLLHSQREVMRESKAAEERLRLATSVSKVGIWEWNLHSSEFTTTLQHDLTFGFKAKAENWSYLTFKRHLHPLDRDKVTTAIDNAISCGTDFEIDFKIIWPDGSIHWLRKFGKVEVGSDGAPSRVIGTCTDITDQRESEDAMKEALFYRDEFLSIASHELKTPLTSLKLQSQVYKRNVGRKDATAYQPEKLIRLMDQVDVQVNRLVRLVDDMLDISRIRTGNLSMLKINVDLHLLLEEMIEKAKPLLPTPDLICFNSTGSVSILCDSMRIEQVINNLLNNALRYGKGTPVAVTLASVSNEVHITVSDMGMGISKEDQLKIFNRFQRAVPAREVSGLGLGLYIAKEIVEAHSGKISVESEVGQGATFTVKIPHGVQV